MGDSTASAASPISTRKTRFEIAKRARACVGSRYWHLGRQPPKLDCLGVFLYALGWNEDELPEVAAARQIEGGYYTSEKWARPGSQGLQQSVEILLAGLTKRLLTIRLHRAVCGDILAMRFKSERGAADHLGILVDGGELVHADIRRGVVCEPFSGELERRVVAAYRKV